MLNMFVRSISSHVRKKHTIKNSPLSIALHTLDKGHFFLHLLKMENPKWMPAEQSPTLLYVANNFAASAYDFTDTVDYSLTFYSILKGLEPYHEAKDYSQPKESATPLSILAGIDDPIISQFFDELFTSRKEIGDFDDLLLNGNNHIDLPIIQAALTGSIDTIKVLCNFAADINKPSAKHNCTALHYAVAKQRWNMVKALLTYGADPDLENNHGMKAVDLIKCQTQKEAYLSALKESGRELIISSDRSQFIRQNILPMLANRYPS